MHNTSHWDKRSWLLAFGGGNLCGLMYVFGDAAVRHRDTVEVGFLFLASCLFFSAFALPGWVTVLAKRHYLLWGVLPQTLTVLWIAATTHALRERLPIGLQVNLILYYAALSVCMVVCISLYRYVQQREAALIIAQEQAARDRYAQATQDAQTPQEGVWPPPPRRPTP